MTEPETVPGAELPRPAEERRETPRRPHAVAWDLFFRAMRRFGVRATSFYTTLGIFLVGGILLVFIGTIGFALLAEVVREGATQQFDVAALKWIHAHQNPLLTRVMREMTYLGTGMVVIVIVGVSALFLWHTEHKHSARLLLASTIGGIILNNMLKLIFQRERPSVFEWGATTASSSFPSGHAMSATVVYGTVAYLAARLQKHHASRVLTLTAAVLIILGICFTRLYLGVHYPTDVIGGIVVGLAWASFCMATMEASLMLARRRAPAAVAEELPAPKEVAAG